MAKMAKLNGECNQSLQDSKTELGKLKNEIKKSKAQSNEEEKKKV